MMKDVNKFIIVVFIFLICVGCTTTKSTYLGGKIGEYASIKENTEEGGYDVTVYLYFTRSTDSYTVSFYIWEGKWKHIQTRTYDIGKKYGKAFDLWVSNSCTIRVRARAEMSAGGPYAHSVSFEKEFEIP